MSKLINEPNEVVADFLRGLAATHLDLRIDAVNRLVLRRAGCRQGKVALVSGGGSGHEPLHCGFVGTGMLDAACIGEVFTSPTPNHVLMAIQAVDAGAGVLLIVKNYAGDQMNFEIAADRAGRAGIDVRTITIDDDVAGSSSHLAGRRGIGLTVIAEKILGSAAEEGLTLSELFDLGQALRGRGRSMGIGMSSCVHPATGVPTFEIGADEIEIGIGIHGERGWRRAKAGSAAEIASLLVDSILADLQPPPASSFIVLVNGMGGTPLIELYVVAGEVSCLLGERGHVVVRYLVGSYITSLEMAGCSLTLLQSDAVLLRHWDAPVATPALRWGTAA